MRTNSSKVSRKKSQMNLLPVWSRGIQSSGKAGAQKLSTASNADWHLGGRYFHWNKSPGRLWIMSNGERQNHIGYFLAVQGNELDHIFVYIGNDVKVDSVKYKLVADVANHQSDSECVKSNGARVTDKEDCILNQYWVLMTRWRESCSIYCENEQVRQLFEEKLKIWNLIKFILCSKSFSIVHLYNTHSTLSYLVSSTFDRC